MRPQRPTSILVIGILHLIGGGMGLLSFLVLVGMYGLLLLVFRRPGAPANPTLDQELYLHEHVPSYTAFTVAWWSLYVVLGVALLAAGFGLCRMRPWARWLSVGYACLSIVSKIVYIVYFLALLRPAFANFVAEKGSLYPPPALTIQEWTFYSMPISSALIMIYPAVVLYVMLSPSTGRAFAAAGAAGPDEHDEGWKGPEGPGPEPAVAPGPEERPAPGDDRITR
jgi:hypothetical protein